MSRLKKTAMRSALVGALAVAEASVAGCTDGICPTVIHSSAAAQTKVSDGMRAIDQVQALVQNVAMPVAVAGQLRDHIDEFRRIMGQINSVLAGALRACTEPNFEDKFKALSKIWSSVRSILTRFGRVGTAVVYVEGSTVSAVESLPIRDPIFYK